MREEITDRQRGVWLWTALFAPVAQTAFGCSWLTAATVGALCLFTAWGVRRAAPVPGPGLALVQCLWNGVMLSQILEWSALGWPNHPYGRVVGLALLLLALWSVGKGVDAAARVCCTLIWPVASFLGVVLLSGLFQVEPTLLRPQWRMDDALLIPVLLMTALPGGDAGKSGVGIYLMTVAVSAVTGGVLGAAVEIASPIYQLSRSVSLLGAVQRYESLAAAAMTMGCFASAVWLLSRQKILAPQRSLWPGVLIAGGLYLSGWTPDSRILALGSIAVWVVLPLLSGFFQKAEKRT